MATRGAARSCWEPISYTQKKKLWAIKADRIGEMKRHPLVPVERNGDIGPPLTIDRTRQVIPLYVKIPPEYNRLYSLFEEKRRGDIYISLFCLDAIGCGRPENLQMAAEAANTDWPAIQNEFVATVEEAWQAERIYFTSHLTVRDKDGNIEQLVPEADAEGWTEFIGKMFSPDGVSGFKPSRHTAFDLMYPLKIQPLTVNVRLLTALELQGGTFQLFIDTINEEARKSDKPKMLELAPLDYNGNDGNGEHYMQLSKSPFELYVTWIHKIDWHRWMVSLQSAEGRSSIRKFPRIEQLQGTLETILTNVGSGDMDLNEEAAQGGRKMDYRREAVKTILQYWGRDAVEVFLGVDLSAQKILAAAGKRGGELSQAASMGNVSATQLAEDLGWEVKRLKSGCMAAEWLHLVAFSWGGFDDEGVDGGWGTSQNLENLVFGTSETNSLMTRYESAWQALFKAEQKLNKRWKAVRPNEPNSEIWGELDIVCNSEDTIPVDVQTTNGYMLGNLKFKDDSIQEDQTPSMPASHYRPDQDGSDRVEQIQGDTTATTQKQILALAHEFPFMPYSVQYNISTDFFSRILDTPRPGTSVNFYPYLRPLYHSAEATLDSMFFTAAEALAEAQIERIESAFKVVRKEISDKQKNARNRRKVIKDKKPKRPAKPRQQVSKDQNPKKPRARRVKKGLFKNSN